MTTIIKLLIAALVLNAAAQAGLAYFKLYQFQDAMHEVLLFAPNASDAELTDRVMDLAAEHGVPLDRGNIAFRTERFERAVEAPYVEEVTLVPGVYTKAWEFAPTTSVRVMPVGRPAR
jgi:hypothetical protein